MVKDVPAGAGRLVVGAVGPLPQGVGDVIAQRLHVEAEQISVQCSIADAMPVLKHLVGKIEQALADFVRGAGAIAEGLPVAI